VSPYLRPSAIFLHHLVLLTGPGTPSSPRHRMPLNSTNEGLQCSGSRWVTLRASYKCSYHVGGHLTLRVHLQRGQAPHGELCVPRPLPQPDLRLRLFQILDILAVQVRVAILDTGSDRSCSPRHGMPFLPPRPRFTQCDSALRLDERYEKFEKCKIMR